MTGRPEAEIEAAAAVLFAHAQFMGDAYTARQLARWMFEAAARAALGEEKTR